MQLADLLQPARRPAPLGRVRIRLIGALALIALLVIGTLVARHRANAGKPGGLPLDAEQCWTVQRGPLIISLLAPGTIKAKTSNEIKCMVPGDVKILWIVDEGTMVKKGDKLVELECGKLQEDVVRQRVNVASNQAEYDGAVENLEIQKSQNRSEQLRAKNALYMAQLDLEKYVSGDYKQKLREKESAIKLAEAELKRARDRLGWTEKLLKKGYVNRGEFEADQLAQTKQEIELERASNDKELLEKYEYKRELSQLETTKKQSEEELIRVKRACESELHNKKIAVDSAKARLDLEKYQLDKLEVQLANTVINAPQDGMVVYPQEGGRLDDSNRIRMGAQVHRHQKIIDLPDFSAWQVETRVHESRIQEVKMGQSALVSIDSFPGQTLEAHVGRIGMLPDSTRWFMPDTKEYLVNLDLTTTTLALKPGMSVKAEVMLDSLEDVIYVPIQAVSTLNGHSAVWVKGEGGPRCQEVDLGGNNDRFVEVRNGLRQGDIIYMQSLGESAESGVIKRPSDQGGGEGEDADKKQSERKDRVGAADKKASKRGNTSARKTGPTQREIAKKG